jgi:hypothetical protein
MIIDDNTVITGSFSFTKAAIGEPDADDCRVAIHLVDCSVPGQRHIAAGGCKGVA